MIQMAHLSQCQRYETMSIFDKLIYIPNGVIVDITTSSHRPCAEISKWHPMNRLCDRSSIGSVEKIEPIPNATVSSPSPHRPASTCELVFMFDGTLCVVF